MSIREWRWYHWLITIGVLLLVILGSVLIFALLQPETFVPPAPPPEIPIAVLPPPVPGPPELPPPEVERIPFSEITGLSIIPETDIIATGDLTQIRNVTEFPVNFVTLAPNGRDLNYYDPETNRFYSIDSDGIISKIGDQIFAEAENVVWAPNSTDSIVEFPDGSNIRYNFETNEQVTLPAHWDDFDFSPDSNRIAFKSNALDPQERWLAISDSSGGSTRRIEHLGDRGDILDVDWAPNNQVIGTYSEPAGLSQSELFFLGFNGENFPLTRVHGLKAEGKWRPAGDKLVYSSIHQDSNFNPTLWVVDGTGGSMGQNRKRINLQTWTDKCTFVDDINMYCGVPIALPRGAGLIPSVANDIPDDIYHVNTETGNVTRVAIPETDINVKQLSVSDDGKTLFIHDRYTNTVKKVQVEE